MTSLRRHLASLGLTMVLCHIVLQVLVPAALCCHQASVGRAKKAAAEKDCCSAGAHPGQVCPLHGAKSAKQAATDCQATSQQDFHDLIVVLNSGGVIASPVALILPTGSESAFVAAEPHAIPVAHVPPGPPPRV